VHNTSFINPVGHDEDPFVPTGKVFRPIFTPRGIRLETLRLVSSHLSVNEFATNCSEEQLSLKITTQQEPQEQSRQEQEPREKCYHSSCPPSFA